MSSPLRILRLLAIASLGACVSAPPAQRESVAEGAEHPDLAITHANVLDVESGRWLPDHTVLIRNGRVASVAPATATRTPAGSRIIDATGQYVVPGLFDMHVHLEHFPTPDMLALFVAHGVTSVRNMDGRAHILEWRRRTSRGALLGPLIYSAGPVLDGDPPIRDDNTVVRNPEEARAAVLAQADSGYDFIKVYTNLSAESYSSIVRAARERGLTVSGHFPRFSNLEAVLAGHRSLEHVTEFSRVVESADSPFRNRFHWSKLYLAMPFDAARADSVARRVAASGMWATPTLIQSERALAPPDSLEAWLAAPHMRYIPADARAFWRRQVAGASARLDGDEWRTVELGRENRLRMVGALHRAEVGLLIGTDTPNPFVVPGQSLHAELELMVEAGLTPAQALRAATLGAASFLGADSLGRVSPGARADLILLAADPLGDIRNTRAISGVVLGGIHHVPKAFLEAAERAARTP